MSVENPFLAEETAPAYARARPDYHAAALAAAVRALDIATPVPLAVDVGCGTGMSTRALRRVADRAVGLDVSRARCSKATFMQRRCVKVALLPSRSPPRGAPSTATPARVRL